MGYEQIKKLTKIAGEITGEYKCTNCGKYKKIEGGKITIATNGSKRWKCAFCLSQRIAPTVVTRGAGSTGGGVNT